MAEPTTWTELKANVADWLNRTDLTTQIPEFIGYAERRFSRVLRVPEMEDAVTASASAGTVTLPSNFLQMRSAYLDTDPKTVLEQMTLATLRNAYAEDTTGQPRNYALQSGSEIVFGPSPDTSYDVILNYYEKIPALGASNADNWLLLAHPDIYMNAALAEAYSFLKDEGRADRFEAKTAGRIAELNEQARRMAYGAAPIRIRSSQVV